MSDSWEDDAGEAPAAPKPAGFNFNPNAATFSFNPNAASFSFAPGGAAAPAPAAAEEPAVDAAADAVAAVSVSEPEPPAPAPPPPAPAEPEEEEEAPGPVESEEEKVERARAAQEEKERMENKLRKEREREEERIANEARLLEEEDKREHLNLVFIGHVDAGKSTIGGQILFCTGSVDDRTIAKYEREAKDKNRDSWYMAYIMDTNDEERAKGKTVEVGRAHFETAAKRYTILDAPGHKNYVPNMIAGAAQADVAVLVIAARKGEFETGFERGGQTREHAQLAKTLGVAKLIVVVNKMDDPSVKWSSERFEEVQSKLTPFLKSCGYNTKKDVYFVPISGLHGYNVKDVVPKDMCSWYSGPSFFQILDNLEPQDRNPDAPFRLPIIDRFRDMGIVIMGKTESGTVTVGDKLTVMPTKQQVKVIGIKTDSADIARARPGENVFIRVEGVEEDAVQAGFVLCSPEKPIVVSTDFEALLSVLELHEHKSIFTAGYKAVLHIHTIVCECEVIGIVSEIDPKTKQPKKGKALFLRSGSIAQVRIRTEYSCCLEKFKDVPQLGRFTLRDEGKTIAIGKVERIKKLKEDA